MYLLFSKKKNCNILNIKFVKDLSEWNCICADIIFLATVHGGTVRSTHLILLQQFIAPMFAYLSLKERSYHSFNLISSHLDNLV